MHSKSLLSAVLFSAATFAQVNDYNINEAEVSKVITDVENYVTTLEANPAFQSDVAALSADLPASVVQEAENDPAALLDGLAAAATLPAWVSAIPTSVLNSLETLVAEPFNAVADVENFAETVLDEAAASSIILVLETAVPTSVQDALASDPISFVDNLITATALPSWASDIPAPIQSDLGSVINEVVSIVDSDFEQGPAPTPTAPYYPPGGYSSSSGFYPTVVIETPTGTGTGVAATGTPSGSPIAFVGAAAPMRTAGAGAAALIVGAGIFANL